MIQVDVVCPMYRDIIEINRFFDKIKNQKNIAINSIVIPHTLCGDEKIDNQIEEIVKKHSNTIYFSVNKKDFSHSLTRQKAIEEYCTSDIVVLCSQDVILNDELAIYNLAKEINDEIVYCYGRQICSKKTIEKYTREKNYGDKNIVVSKEDIDRLQIMAFFASDAFSALNRNVFIKIGGYQGYNVMMNEDQLYSKFVLDNGYKKMYVADAKCEHSHKFTLKQLYNRYYQTGIFYKNIKIFDGYKVNDSGLKLALYVLKRALMQFNIPVLFRWLPDMTARYLGMKKGKKSK